MIESSWNKFFENHKSISSNVIDYNSCLLICSYLLGNPRGVGKDRFRIVQIASKMAEDVIKQDAFKDQSVANEDLYIYFTVLSLFDESCEYKIAEIGCAIEILKSNITNNHRCKGTLNDVAKIIENDRFCWMVLAASSSQREAYIEGMIPPGIRNAIRSKIKKSIGEVDAGELIGNETICKELLRFVKYIMILVYMDKGDQADLEKELLIIDTICKSILEWPHPKVLANIKSIAFIQLIGLASRGLWGKTLKMKYYVGGVISKECKDKWAKNGMRFYDDENHIEEDSLYLVLSAKLIYRDPIMYQPKKE